MRLMAVPPKDYDWVHVRLCNIYTHKLLFMLVFKRLFQVLIFLFLALKLSQ